MKKILTIFTLLCIAIFAVFLVNVSIVRSELVECLTLLEQSQEYKNVWWATPQQAETCAKGHNIILSPVIDK